MYSCFVCMWLVVLARLFTHGWVAPAGLALLPPACGLDELVASSRLVAHPVVLSLLQAALVCVAICHHCSVKAAWSGPQTRNWRWCVTSCCGLLSTSCHSTSDGGLVVGRYTPSIPCGVLVALLLS